MPISSTVKSFVELEHEKLPAVDCIVSRIMVTSDDEALVVTSTGGVNYRLHSHGKDRTSRPMDLRKFQSEGLTN